VVVEVHRHQRAELHLAVLVAVDKQQVSFLWSLEHSQRQSVLVVQEARVQVAHLEVRVELPLSQVFLQQVETQVVLIMWVVLVVRELLQMAVRVEAQLTETAQVAQPTALAVHLLGVVAVAVQVSQVQVSTAVEAEQH
jgi:hypothetical protein